jgi:hypothetical protein
MATLGNRVFDNGLSVIGGEGTDIHVTSQEASDFTEATATYTLGNATMPSVTGPADRTGGGREVTVAALTNGSITGDGTVTHYAIVDTANSRLLATAALTASQVVTDGNTFSLDSFTIGIPDPA